MNELPVVPRCPRDETSEPASAEERSLVTRRDDLAQLRSRLLKMIIENENQRRTPPSNTKT